MLQQEAVLVEGVRHDLSAWDRFRLGMLAVWLLLLVVTVAVGHRPTPVTALEAAAGRVDSVVVLGPARADPDPDPGVHRSRQADLTSRGQLLGWQVPTWVALTALANVLLSFGHLIGVPHTGRATRWAWFWVMAVPVVGTVLMLLLSGRTPGPPAPSTARRPLTGGWAFLVSCAASALLSGATTTAGT